MSKIEKLTEEQQGQLLDFRNYWLAKGRSCELADKKTAEEGIKTLYRIFYQTEPRVWWCDSPLQANIIINILRESLLKNLWVNLGDNLRENLWANLGDNLRANLGANLRANLEANLEDNLRENLEANLRDNLWANLRENLRDNLEDNLRENLRDNLEANLRANLRDNLWANLWANLRETKQTPTSHWGQYDSYWVAYYLFARDVLKLGYTDKENELLDASAKISSSMNLFYPFKNIVIACDRHKTLEIDERGRLHNPQGAAMVFRDGHKIYAWHGVRVPSFVVDAPEKITPDTVNQEINAEVRRVMLLRYPGGQGKYLLDANAKILDEDQDSHGLRTLFFCELAGDEPLVMVRVHCVRKDKQVDVYFLRVPPGTKTCKDAVAWTFPTENALYVPVFES